MKGQSNERIRKNHRRCYLNYLSKGRFIRGLEAIILCNLLLYCVMYFRFYKIDYSSSSFEFFCWWRNFVNPGYWSDDANSFNTTPLKLINEHSTNGLHFSRLCHSRYENVTHLSSTEVTAALQIVHRHSLQCFKKILRKLKISNFNWALRSEICCSIKSQTRRKWFIAARQTWAHKTNRKSRVYWWVHAGIQQTVKTTY